MKIMNRRKFIKAFSVLAGALVVAPKMLFTVKPWKIRSRKQTNRLLAQTRISSADYNTVRALVQERIDTFRGQRYVI